jgi:hypothetical protein
VRGLPVLTVSVVPKQLLPAPVMLTVNGHWENPQKPYMAKTKRINCFIGKQKGIEIPGKCQLIDIAEKHILPGR